MVRAGSIPAPERIYKPNKIKDMKRVKEISTEAWTRRVNYMKQETEKYLEHVEELHISVSPGNKKMGAIASVSTRPVVDCRNCSKCNKMCYDLRNDVWRPDTQKSRARNAAILHANRDRFFAEVDASIKRKKVFRWHVGGDIIDLDYFDRMTRIARNHTACTFLIFTKSFKVVNRWCKLHGIDLLPNNMQIIFSHWYGLDVDNPYEFPTSHPIDVDGNTTCKHTESTYMCTLNCMECFTEHKGCFALRRGTNDSTTFKVH